MINSFLFNAHDYTLNDCGKAVEVFDSQGELVCTVELSHEYYIVIEPDGNITDDQRHENLFTDQEDATIVMTKCYIESLN